MKRYDCGTCQYPEPMDESPVGDWVRFEDVAELKAKADEYDRLIAELEQRLGLEKAP